MLPQASDWDRHWRSQTSDAGASWSKKRIMAVLKPILRPGLVALDAGSGTGFFARFFCETGLRTIALDWSERSLEKVRAATRNCAEIVKADLVRDNLAGKIGCPVDIVFTDGLLEHFVPVDQDRILRNLASVLSAQGLLVTVVPNRWSPWQLIRPFLMPGIEEAPFVLSGLEQLHLRNGFAIEKSGGLNTLPMALSPEGAVAAKFGMLLYVVARLR